MKKEYVVVYINGDEWGICDFSPDYVADSLSDLEGATLRKKEMEIFNPGAKYEIMKLVPAE